MTVGPAGSTYDSDQLTETLTQSSTTCSKTLMQFIASPCTGQPGPITVGISATDPSGTTLAATSNAFWDIHGIFATRDAMGLAGAPGSCNIVCTQSYSCGTNKLTPDFTVTFTLTHTSSGGTTVTQVTVSKTANN